MRGLALVAVAVLSGGGGVAESRPANPATADWRRVATPADRTRLRNWRPTWLAALAAAQGEDAAGLAREGALFEPDRALDRPIPPAGGYRCRTFKLGAKAGVPRSFTVYSWFDCRVDDEGGVVSFYRAGGSQRPVGLIFPDGPARGIFLGALILGDERRTLEYGRDASRDMAGLVERVGPQRWRIALPEPRFESRLDVIEIVPAE